MYLKLHHFALLVFCILQTNWRGEATDPGLLKQHSKLQLVDSKCIPDSPSRHITLPLWPAAQEPDEGLGSRA